MKLLKICYFASILICLNLFFQACKDDNSIEELAAPILLFPNDSATNINLDDLLKWKKIANAQNYYLQISNNANFDSLVFSVILNDTSAFLSEKIDYNTKYFLRVKAINGNQTSKWSVIWNFNTIKKIIKPKAPTAIEANSRYSSTIALKWTNNDSTTVKYIIEWRDILTGILVGADSVNSTSYILRI